MLRSNNIEAPTVSSNNASTLSDLMMTFASSLTGMNERICTDVKNSRDKNPQQPHFCTASSSKAAVLRSTSNSISTMP